MLDRVLRIAGQIRSRDVNQETGHTVTAVSDRQPSHRKSHPPKLVRLVAVQTYRSKRRTPFPRSGKGGECSPKD